MNIHRRATSQARFSRSFVTSAEGFTARPLEPLQEEQPFIMMRPRTNFQLGREGAWGKARS